MQISKKMFIPMAAVALLGAGAYGLATVSAATATSNPSANLIQKLADTLHVDKSKVQAVFDQDKTDRQAAQEKKYEDRVTQGVTDGKLTAAQKDLLLAEHKQLANEMKTATAASGSDRQAAMQKIRTEANDWAKTNNIEATWLMGGGFEHGHHGMMRGQMKNHSQDGDADDAATPTSSPTPTPGT